MIDIFSHKKKKTLIIIITNNFLALYYMVYKYKNVIFVNYNNI